MVDIVEARVSCKVEDVRAVAALLAQRAGTEWVTVVVSTTPEALAKGLRTEGNYKLNRMGERLKGMAEDICSDYVPNVVVVPFNDNEQRAVGSVGEKPAPSTSETLT